MLHFFACLFAPRLYRIYSRASLDQLGQVYHTNMAEQCGDFALSYMFPAGVVYSLWHRKSQYLLYLFVFYASSCIVRAAGRSFNPTYITFLQVLKRAQAAATTENMEAMRRYDFAFKAWPATYRATTLSRLAREEIVRQEAGLAGYTPTWIISWLIAHTFGIRLIYPGLLVGPLLKNFVEDARMKMIVQQKGTRSKVVSADGYYIDTMFFDRRRMPFIERPNFISIMKEVDTTVGKTLVICCEGNAGFYEIGIASTPIAEGYSVIGWNHPGFGGSSGVPYPVNELNAAEAVFEYAVMELGFNEEDIVLFGWSIGGYPAAYLAARHPNVKGLILDATFDDILPLALPRMPGFMGPLVNATIRDHVNLQISDEVNGFAGPLRIIRRTDDEIIADPPASLTANRGNFLLYDVLLHRYPALLPGDTEQRALRLWINNAHIKDANSRSELERMSLNIPSNPQSLTSAERTNLIIQIAERTLVDFKSTHCNPLPGEYFTLPWSDGSQKRT